MKRLFFIISAIGLISLLIGMAGMDSESLMVPVVMVLVGAALLLIGGKGFERYDNFR